MLEPSRMPEVLGRPAHHNLGVDAALGVEGCGVVPSNTAFRREYGAVLLQRIAQILLQVFPRLGRPPLDPGIFLHKITSTTSAKRPFAMVSPAVLDDLIGDPGLCQEDFRREDTDVLGAPLLSPPYPSFPGHEPSRARSAAPKLGSNRKLVNMSVAAISPTSCAIGHRNRGGWVRRPAHGKGAGRGPVPSGMDRLHA